jgi:hypothetical protein
VRLIRRGLGFWPDIMNINANSRARGKSAIVAGSRSLVAERRMVTAWARQ